MTRQELIERSHRQARNAGFWDKRTGSPEDVAELLMLVISECGEAVEADRKGRDADLAFFDRVSRQDPGDEASINGAPYDGSFVSRFRLFVKDSVGDELSDVVIRIADMMGGLEVPSTYGPGINAFAKYDSTFGSESFCASMFDCVSALFPDSRRVTSLAFQLERCLMCICTLAHHHNIDIERHVLLKLDYNLTRAKMHGKAY